MKLNNLMKVYFFLKPVIIQPPPAMRIKPVVRDVHYILIGADSQTVVERPATFEDALNFPLQMSLYQRRLKGARRGRRPRK